MSLPTRQTRIDARRWAAKEIRESILDISSLPIDKPFRLHDAVTHCCRIIAACASVMSVDGKHSRAKEDLMLGHFLLEAHVKESKARAHSPIVATFVADILLSYVRHARTSLQLRVPAEVYAMVRFVFEHVTASYLAAAPWTNWDVLHRLCQDLQDCVDRHDGPHVIEEGIVNICSEISRAHPALAQEMISYKIEERDPSIAMVTVGTEGVERVVYRAEFDRMMGRPSDPDRSASPTSRARLHVVH